MVMAADPNVSDDEVAEVERSACPTCGSCSGMFTANSMNCLTEALGLSLPGNGTVLATHADREQLFLQRGRGIGSNCAIASTARGCARAAARDRHLRGLRERDDPRHRDGRLDQHDPALAGRGAGGRGRLHMKDIDRLSRSACRSCARSRRTRRSTTSRTCIAPAASWRSSASWRAPACCIPMCRPCTRARWATRSRSGTSPPTDDESGAAPSSGRPGRHSDPGRLQPDHALAEPGRRSRGRLHPQRRARVLAGRRPGRAVRQHRAWTAAW